MKKFLLALLAASLLSGPAFAQSIIVDLNKASLSWSWSQDPSLAGTQDGIPTEFHVKCGPSSGNYTKTTVVQYPTTTVAVRTVIQGSGNWFCVVTAANQVGESGNSNEVPFTAGVIPSIPSGLQVR